MKHPTEFIPDPAQSGTTAPPRPHDPTHPVVRDAIEGADESFDELEEALRGYIEAYGQIDGLDVS